MCVLCIYIHTQRKRTAVWNFATIHVIAALIKYELYERYFWLNMLNQQNHKSTQSVSQMGLLGVKRTDQICRNIEMFVFWRTG